jgi:hypothetical protein
LRGRKATHHNILAPFAATVAATFAVGVGVALARAGRGRLAAATRERSRDFYLHPDEELGEGLRRIALGQIDLASEQIEGRNGELGEHAVHETRKAIKRLRALLRVLRDELGEDTYRREADALRNLAALLSAARDSEVLLGTLEGLMRRHPRKLGRRKGAARLRVALAQEHEREATRTLGDALLRARALGELRALRVEVEGWRLSGMPGTAPAERGLRGIYRRGRTRHRRVAAGKGDQVRAMHEWRKSVKDLRYSAEMLSRREPSSGLFVVPPPGRGRRRRSKPTDPERRLRRVAARADTLGELLGEDHDLALLAELARTKRGRVAGVRVGRRTRRILRKLIVRRRRELRRRALRDGRELYRRRPRRFMGDFRVAYTRGRDRLSRR